MAAAATAAPTSAPAASAAPSAPSAPPAASLSFNGIRVNGRPDLGQFRSVGEKFGWRKQKADAGVKKIIQYEASQVKSLSWLPISQREYQLKVILVEGGIVRFDGFRDADHDALARHTKNQWKVELHRGKVATRGWHWGEYKIDGTTFGFVVDGRTAFDLDTKSIAQVSTAVKNDVTLSFNPEQDAMDIEDQLLEIRFHVPPAQDGDDDNPAEVLKNLLLAGGGSKATGSEAICTVSDIKVLVPAGRYDIQVSKSAVKLQGKSNDFNIPFHSITRMYLLRATSAPHVNLVISLDTPLRKGQTRYQNVVIQFDDKKVIEMPLAMAEKEIEELEKATPNLGTALSPVMTGNEYDILTRVFKALTGKPLVIPGDFKSSANQPSIRCSHKAASGALYPLNKSFIFIPKPVIIVKYDEVVSVDFGRTSGSQTRLFEFRVGVKGGAEYEFSSVDRQEYAPLVAFLQGKGVRIRSSNGNEGTVDAEPSILGADLPSDDDESDEDFHVKSSESEDESLDEDDDGGGSDVDEKSSPSSGKKRKERVPTSPKTSKEKKRKPDSASEKKGSDNK